MADDSLKWLADQGGKFCKVAPWNSKGNSPGKAPIETEWQKKPYTLEGIQPHLTQGGNVGLICGKYSGGLVLLDADENFSGFCETFPYLAKAPRITREGADRGKILIRITDDPPKGKKFKNPGETSPFFEYLGTGNQGVIPPSIHPETGRPYILANMESPIPEFTTGQLEGILQLWTKAGLDLPKPAAERPARERKAGSPGESDLKKRVKEAWPVYDVFDHFGWIQETQKEKGGEIRILHHGGLFVNIDKDIWNLPGEAGTGGDCIAAWHYCKTGKTDKPEGPAFMKLLQEMAEAGGIEIAETSNNGYQPQELETVKSKKQPVIGEKMTKKEAAAAEKRAESIPCPDPGLMQRLTELLTAPKIPMKIKRMKAGGLVLEWLTDHGEFIKSESEELFYLYKPERRLYNLLENFWRAWLYSLTGANPAGTDYAFFQADCETAAMLAKPRPVLKLAAWNNKEQVLRISRFDGTVYKLDGKTITEEGNGENILFEDSQFWQPYNPDFGKLGLFSHVADSYFEGNKSEHERFQLALRIWQLSIFFTELCPTRPALVLHGEKGSGKSMTLRRFLRYLYGHNAELSGVPDKPDGFTAAAAEAHILAIDNLDDFHGWMRDKIARLTTGGIDEYRRLYTNNEAGRVIYRTWLAFTSRTPDTLRRDDLADRLILLPVKRIPQEYLKAERSFLEVAEETRNYWWGDILTRLNLIVADIRAGKLESRARLRMADWESFGRLVAIQENKLSIWDAFINGLQNAQTDFLLEGDLVAEELLEWIENNPDLWGEYIKTKDLYEKISEKFTGKKPPDDWPKSAKSFGRRIGMTREALKSKTGIEWKHDKITGWNYKFSGNIADSEDS